MIDFLCQFKFLQMKMLKLLKIPGFLIKFPGFFQKLSNSRFTGKVVTLNVLLISEIDIKSYRLVCKTCYNITVCW